MQPLRTKDSIYLYNEIIKTLNTKGIKEGYISLKQILCTLKLNNQLLWYYKILSDNGLFYLTGCNKLTTSPYLNLGVENHTSDLTLDFDIDHNTWGISEHTNHEPLYEKTQNLFYNELSVSDEYNTISVHPAEDKMLYILGDKIQFKKDYFSKEFLSVADDKEQLEFAKKLVFVNYELESYERKKYIFTPIAPLEDPEMPEELKRLLEYSNKQ